MRSVAVIRRCAAQLMKIMILGQTIFDAERWQHVGYCVDEDEDEDDDDDGSFNDT